VPDTPNYKLWEMVIHKIAANASRYLEFDYLGLDHPISEDDSNDYLISCIYASFIEQTLFDRLDQLVKMNHDKAQEFILESMTDDLVGYRPEDVEPKYSEDMLVTFPQSTLTYEEYEISSNLLSHLPSKAELSLNRRELANVILKSLDQESTGKKESKNIFLLDEVDLQLYKTLIAHPDLIKTLDWRLFEKLLADVIETFEYEVELTKPTKDGGIDIVAIKRSTSFGPHRYLIQAKRWTNKVGIEPVRSLVFFAFSRESFKVMFGHHI
jgi:hypothetical protein